MVEDKSATGIHHRKQLVLEERDESGQITALYSTEENVNGTTQVGGSSRGEMLFLNQIFCRHHGHALTRQKRSRGFETYELFLRKCSFRQAIQQLSLQTTFREAVFT